MYNEQGDTIRYAYPPHDGAYDTTQIIIKFKPGALNTTLLCYVCPSNNNTRNTIGHVLEMPNSCKDFVMNQRFYIDSCGIIMDTVFRNAMISVGGDYLQRLTAANPCRDTLSITRIGDTIKIEDWNWMLLKLKNNYSPVNAATLLTMAFQSQIVFAELDYYIAPLSSTPRDQKYGSEVSLTNELTGVETAWDYEVGDDRIKCGVIDDGIKDHCDLNGGGLRSILGYSYHQKSATAEQLGQHGTPSAGIIGAYTNRTLNSCLPSTNPVSIAGIAGGWGPMGGDQDRGTGISLRRFEIWGQPVPYLGRVSDAVSAIREASAHSVDTDGSGNPLYGYSCEILNNSWGIWTDDNQKDLWEDYTPSYSMALRSAVCYAMEHEVSFVAARGNRVKDILEYPACLDPSWVSNVSGTLRSKQPYSGSGYDG